mmetsp:Transcript_95200/g.188600  ORF Transcript_95200/g.188600 Transcript_95200/m.188600 type:complete len:94 (+) Transcript_95200:202-483(+)
MVWASPGPIDLQKAPYCEPDRSQLHRPDEDHDAGQVLAPKSARGHELRACYNSGQPSLEHNSDYSEEDADAQLGLSCSSQLVVGKAEKGCLQP